MKNNALKALTALAAVYAVLAGAILAVALVAFVVGSVAELIGLALQAIPVAAAVLLAGWAAGKVQGVPTREVFAAVKRKAAGKVAKSAA